MPASQFVPCARCANEECCALVIIASVPPEMKLFKPGGRTLKMICPACRRFFSVALADIEYRSVTAKQVVLGFAEALSDRRSVRKLN